ncbi:MAG: hypothetical protein COB98_02945 [Flavobacteriaceae bacterium]|nr:MAG: hypothetical protein COB98_02945 [Flavobacteriaceae bacterium]
MLKKTRQYHNWIGLILSIPTFIVGITALLITFENTYKDTSSEPIVNVSWLPGYSNALSSSEKSDKNNRIRASLSLTPNLRYIGTTNGLFQVEKDRLISIPSIEGIQVHCIKKVASSIWIGTKKGLFKMDLSSQITELKFNREIHQIESPNDSTLIVSDHKTLFISNNNGISWRKDSSFQALEFPISTSTSSRKTTSIKLHKLIMDMHTGKAFFGKKFEGIWIFILGLTVSVLSLTGIYMWYKKRSNKAKRAKKASVIKQKKLEE